MVDHNENPNWDENSPYPLIGYQVFYRLDIDQLHKFKAEYESKERILVNPENIRGYHHSWDDMYQEILDCALQI